MEDKDKKVTDGNNIEEKSDLLKTNKKPKAKLIAIIIISIFVPFLILSFITMLFSNKENGQNSNIITRTPPDVYKYSGKLLFSREVGYNDLIVSSEFIAKEGNIGDIKLVTLHNNKLISFVIAAENIDITEITDYGIYLMDYDNDKNYDFAYINSIAKDGSKYKTYTIEQNGDIKLLNDEEYLFKTKKVSPLLTKEEGRYTYKNIDVYYDDYPVEQEVGTYKLEKKADNDYSDISEESKISVPDVYDVLQRKGTISDEGKGELLKVNNALSSYDKLIIMNVDLDNDGVIEKIVYAVNNKKNLARVFLFDEDNILLESLMTVNDSNYEMNDVVELADIDQDGILEIFLINREEKTLKISKYYCNYLF